MIISFPNICNKRIDSPKIAWETQGKQWLQFNDIFLVIWRKKLCKRRNLQKKNI